MEKKITHYSLYKTTYSQKMIEAYIKYSDIYCDV